MTKTHKLALDLVKNMSANQIEKYCSRHSIWWQSQDEFSLRERQESLAVAKLEKEIAATKE